METESGLEGGIESDSMLSVGLHVEMTWQGRTAMSDIKNGFLSL
jgi:hypothetical protein